MSTRAKKIARRRARVRALRAEGLSQREVAAQLNVGVGTVATDCLAEKPKPAFDNAAGPGNTRSLVHGARSEQRLAPLREKHVDALRRDFPQLDARRLALLADRLARIEAASRWLDQQQGIVRDEHGEVFGVVAYLERWQSRAETVLREIAEEHKQSRRFAGLSDYLEADSGAE